MQYTENEGGSGGDSNIFRTAGELYYASTGALIGGIAKGLRAMKNGGKFWSGDGMTIDVVNYYEIDDPEMLKVNNPTEATDANLEKYVRDKFPNADIDPITKMSTENIPSEIGLDGINRLGMTKTSIVYRAAANEWSFSGLSEMYIHPNVFNNAVTLQGTIAHELLHVSQNYALMGVVYNESMASTYEILKEGYAYDFACRKFGDGCGQFNKVIENASSFNILAQRHPELSRLLNWRNFSWTQ